MITFELYIVTTIFICSKRALQILDKVCKEIKIGLVPLLLKLIKQLGTWWIRLFQSPSLLVSGSGSSLPLSRSLCHRKQQISGSRFALDLWASLLVSVLKGVSLF